MVRCAVIALAVIFHRELPIAVLNQIHLPRHLRIAQPMRKQIALHLRRHRLDVLRRIGRQAHEDQPRDGSQRYRPQSAARRIEPIPHVIGKQQRAIQPIRPAMVTANQVADPPLAIRNQLRPAMPADVVKRPHHPVAIPQDHHGCAPDAQSQHIADLGHVRIVPHENPVPPENQRHVGVEHRAIGIERRLQAMARPAIGQQTGNAIGQGTLGFANSSLPDRRTCR